MPPIRKNQLDKAAWSWAEDQPVPSNISDLNLDIAYRGIVPRCKLGSCRRNCRGNPYCLSALGESKWLSDNVVETEEEDFDLQIRAPGTFVGLKNLGATCYVNSLVQLLFHNPAFRRALFLWNPVEEFSRASHSVVEQLQFLFGLMQFGQRKSLDPLDFIKSLDLDASLQQDAQEFSKLLFSLLEDSLLKNHIAENFSGEYSYITRCSKCRNDSVSPSKFYELDLNVKGHKTLHESICEFLKEEKLEGDNKYFCSFCNDKQEAARFISLEKIPPVLNLQLMRFIYDRQKGSKKKITSSLQFPDTLDMGHYMSSSVQERKPILYNLTAVLIHKGPSANSGHYVSHICDQTTGTWYKFNDELVEKVEGKQLKLGSDDDEFSDGSKKAKPPRLAKGYLESSNAYMLVYTSQSIQEVTKPITEEDLRPELFEKIKKSNEDFARLIAETKVQKNIRRENSQAIKSEMSSLVKIMPVIPEGNREWEAISSKWLTQWLSSDSYDMKPVDNSAVLCPHSKLHPDLISSVKYISVTAADIIYGKYGGGPRLPASEAICLECVSAKCRTLKFRAKLIEDAKEIASLLKQKETMQAGFWVGKKSLKNWRKKASLLFEGREDVCSTVRETEDCPSPSSDNDGTSSESPSVNNRKSPQTVSGSTTPSNCLDHSAVASNDNQNGETDSKSKKRKHECQEKEKDGNDEVKNGVKSDEEDCDPEDFNLDLICFHGNFTPDVSLRRLVSESLWRKLKFYFPDCKEFPVDAEVCSDCLCVATQDQAFMELQREQATVQKEMFFSLVYGRNRPSFTSGTHRVVCVPEFLRPWRKFVKENGRSQPLYCLRNSTLVCQHGLLLYNPGSSEDSAFFCPVTNEEWENLQKFFSVDTEISVTYGETEAHVIQTVPRLCEECHSARLVSEQEALLQYEKAKVYIRRISSTTNNHKKEDVDSSSENGPAPKKTASGCGKPSAQPCPEPANTDAIRRSTRHRRTPGERQVFVSSTDTVRDLKLKILNVFGVAPFDQHLYTDDGRELDEPSSTLSAFNIFPNSVLNLKVDEPTEDTSSLIDDYSPASEPEAGFKGTVLLKR